MSGFRVTVAAAYCCLLGLAWVMAVASLSAPGGGMGFIYPMVLGLPWSGLGMVLLVPWALVPWAPKWLGLLLAVWMVVISPLINVCLLLGLHHVWRAPRPEPEVESAAAEQSQ